MRQALALLGNDLPQDLAQRAHTVLDVVDERDALDPTTIVAAFVGATGSGKSSLFNAVCGADLARSDVIRPTTRVGLAALPHTDASANETTHDTASLAGEPASAPAAGLLDWLGVQQRVALPPHSPLGPGIVLIDVPDIDSVDISHRELAQRLAERVDVLIWVVDPQKYADNVIHSQWIAPMASRAQATLVALNHADRLDDAQRSQVTTSLHTLLLDDGIADPRIVLTSAVTGEGIDTLVGTVNQISATVRQRAIVREAQLSDLRRDIAAHIGCDDATPVPTNAVDRVSAAVAQGISTSRPVTGLVTTVQRAYAHRRIAACGWLPIRLLRRFRSDPLRRLHLSGGGGDSLSTVDLSALMGPAGVSVELRNAVDSIAKGRPEVWAQALRSVGRAQANTLTDALQVGIARTDLGMGRAPRWWVASATLQWIMWACVLVGGAWLTAVHLVSAYLLVSLPMPMLALPCVPWQEVPLPSALVLGGLFGSLVVAFLSAMLGWVGARRRGDRARRALHRTVEAVVTEHVGGPLGAEVTRQNEIGTLLGWK